jgi:hypothetical protein
MNGLGRRLRLFVVFAPAEGIRVEERGTGQLHLHNWRFCRRFTGI